MLGGHICVKRLQRCLEFSMFNMYSNFARVFDWLAIVTLYPDCVTGNSDIFVWRYQ